MQFVQTDMGAQVDSKFVGMMGGFVPMEMVVKGMYVCVCNFFLFSSIYWPKDGGDKCLQACQISFLDKPFLYIESLFIGFL